MTPIDPGPISLNLVKVVKDTEYGDDDPSTNPDIQLIVIKAETHSVRRVVRAVSIHRLL